MNGGNFWRLTFHGLDDGLTYEMTVDPAYNNFKRSGWNQIVQDEYPFGVYAGLRRIQKQTAQGIPILSADGRARIIYRCANDHELAQLVEANVQSFQKSSNTFQELFQ